MEDPQAIADLLADEADDDFTYEEVEVMRYVFRVFWRYLCVFSYSCRMRVSRRLSEEDDDGASEDLDAALRSLKAFTNNVGLPLAMSPCLASHGQCTRPKPTSAVPLHRMQRLQRHQRRKHSLGRSHGSPRSWMTSCEISSSRWALPGHARRLRQSGMS